MERIYDNRPYRFVNCGNSDCPNTVGPFTYGSIRYPVYCSDCVDEAVDTMLGRKEE